MAGLSEEDIAHLRTEFLSFDTDGDGTISSDELATILRSFGDEITEEQVKKVIETFDIDGNGTIEFQEFVIMMAHKAKPGHMGDMQKLIKKAFSRRAQIRKTFESFDKVYSQTLSQTKRNMVENRVIIGG